MEQRGLIPSGDIAKVRAATSIVGLFEGVTSVKRQGARFFALCPFHEERTASMSIDEGQGLYFCFGCGAAGDAVRFVEVTKQYDFPEAVQWLADRAGITINYEESETARSTRVRHRKLHDAIDKAADFYEQQLFESPDARPAREYLRSRGWSGEVARRFGVGWAPLTHGAVQSLRLSNDVAYEAGIAYKDKTGRAMDLLRGRVTFPIFEPGGKPVAIAGRLLPGNDGPKYVNFSETPLYQKRRLLYGLNWAKKPIADADEVVVCEGYTDVIAFHLAGIERAVATCGIALTEEHVRLLARFARRIVVAFDADSAGEGGVERLHQWEAKNQVEFAIVTLPEGEDPASLFEKGRTSDLANAVAVAKPLLAWRIEQLLAQSPLDTPERRVATAEKAMEIINSHHNELLRDQYAAIVAERCGVEASKLKPRRLVRRAPTEPQRKTKAMSGPEFEALRLEMVNPEGTREWLIPQLLSDELVIQVLAALRASDSLADAIHDADDPVATVVAQLSMEQPVGDPNELRAQLTVAAALRSITQLSNEFSRDPEEADYLLKVSTWLRSTASLVTDSNDEEALIALRDWLAERPDPTISFVVERETSGGGGAKAHPDQAAVFEAPDHDRPAPADPPDGYLDSFEDDEATPE